MNAEAREDLLQLLDPFSAKRENITEILHSPCFIGFVDPHVFNDKKIDYMKQYIEVAEKHVEQFYEKLESNRMDINKTALLLLPFSCLDDLVEKFISYMGIEK